MSPTASRIRSSPFRREGYRLFTDMQAALRHDVITRFFRLEARPIVATETVLTAQRGRELSGMLAPAAEKQKQQPRLNRAARRAQERRNRKRRARTG